METKNEGAHGILLQQVTESTVAVIDPRLQSNAAAIVFDDFIVAVDAGMRPYAARLFREALESTHRRPVRFVCVTHKHMDHTFGLSAFKDVTLFGSRHVAAALERSPEFTPEARVAMKRDEPGGGGWLDEVERVVPALLIHERLDIVCRGRVAEFHHTGGHTSCSVYGYVPGEKVLLTGDLVFAGEFPFAGDDTADPEVWMSTLRAWLDLDVEHVIPGHGPVSGPEEIRRQLVFLEALKRNTLEAITAGRSSGETSLPAGGAVVEQPWFVEKTLERWHSYYRSRP